LNTFKFEQPTFDFDFKPYKEVYAGKQSAFIQGILFFNGQRLFVCYGVDLSSCQIEK